MASTPSLARWRMEPGRRGRFQDRVSIALAVAGVVVPPLADLILHGWRRVFSYFAADVFYYLTVAKNFAAQGSLSFDQEHATNGFHPLWQLTTGALYFLCDSAGMSEEAFLVAVFLACLALLGLGVALIGQAFQRGWGRVPVALPLLPVGLYALCMVSLEPHYGSLWSYANGMESAVSFAAFAWALRCMVVLECRRGGGSVLSAHRHLGLALSLVLLARLDHGLLAVGAALVYGWRAAGDGKVTRTRLRVALALPLVLTLAGYAALNACTTGVLLPVSGALKSSFPHPSWNHRYLLRLVFHPDLAGPGDVWRIAQIVLPAVVAASLLPLQWLRAREGRDPLARPLAVCAGFVLALAAYDFLFVGLWYQGHWYFPVSVPLMTVFALHLLECERAVQGRAAALVGGFATACTAVFFTAGFHDAKHNQNYARFYDTRSELREYFEEAPPKIVEYDDGIVAFSSGFPALSGLGFTADPEAVPWLKRGRILWLAYRRGFDHVASLNYFDARGITRTSSSQEIRDALASTFYLDAVSVDPFDFEVAYLAERRDLVVFRMILRQCPEEPGLCDPPLPKTLARSTATRVPNPGRNSILPKAEKVSNVYSSPRSGGALQPPLREK